MNDRTKAKCFLIMPFGREYAKLHSSIRRVVKESGCSLRRLDDVHVGEWLNNSLVRHLRSCDFVVSVLTGDNANVLFETGYALALYKPVIALSERPTGQVSDIRSFRMLKYNKGKLDKLEAELGMAIQRALGSGISYYQRQWEQDLLAASRESVDLVRRDPDFNSEAAYLRHLIRSVSELRAGDAVWAVCGKKDWSSKFVSKYFDANAEAVVKGVEIERIFVIVDKRSRRAAEEHKALGVKVRTVEKDTVLRQEIAAIPLDLGFAIIGHQEAVVHWEHGKTIRGSQFTDAGNLEQFRSVYQNLRGLSDEL